MSQKANILIIGGEKTDISGELERLCGIIADYSASENEASEAIREKNYDMIFLNLPDDNAVSALFKVREASYRYTYLPVVALTHTNDPGFFTERGINGILLKPVGAQALSAILRKWLPDDKIGPLGGGGPALNPGLKAVMDECGLNVKLSLARLNGLQKVLEITMRAVGASIPSRNEKMAEALRDGNIEDFTIDIHGIKSSLASIGAVDLADMAAALEASAKVGDSSYCSENFPAFVEESESLGEHLRKYFPKQ